MQLISCSCNTCEVAKENFMIVQNWLDKPAFLTLVPPSVRLLDSQIFAKFSLSRPYLCNHRLQSARFDKLLLLRNHCDIIEGHLCDTLKIVKTFRVAPIAVSCPRRTCNIDVFDVFVILRCIKRRASIILREINQEITSQGG